jgi:hypothetical protein
VLDAVRRLTPTVDECVDARPWSLPDAELVDSLAAVWSAQQRLTVLVARLAAEAGNRGLPADQGCTSTAVWLRNQLRMSVSTGRRLVELGRLVDRRPVLEAAVSAGAVTVDQAGTIATAMASLPAAAGLETLAAAESALIGAAAQLDPQALRACGQRILGHLERDTGDEDSAAERAERAYQRARAGRALYLARVEDGRVRLTGWLDSEAAAVVTAALDPLCRPVPGDDRTPTQRRADALADVCGLALRTTTLPDNGGDRPQIVITVPYDPLRARLGAGTLDVGAEVPATQVRRLACDAQLIPAVLGGDGEALDLGRARRLFTGAARRALVLRDRGCAFPSCDRPSRWTDAHHIRSWADGGRTDVDNGVLLCGYHHRLVHGGGWDVRLGRDGRPEFLPPPHLDPQRRPRRNLYHLRT